MNSGREIFLPFSDKSKISFRHPSISETHRSSSVGDCMAKRIRGNEETATIDIEKVKNKLRWVGGEVGRERQ